MRARWISGDVLNSHAQHSLQFFGFGRFDFLTLADDARERDLERGLLEHLREGCWNWGRALRFWVRNTIYRSEAARRTKTIFISTCCSIM